MSWVTVGKVRLQRLSHRWAKLPQQTWGLSFAAKPRDEEFVLPKIILSWIIPVAAIGVGSSYLTIHLVARSIWTASAGSALEVAAGGMCLGLFLSVLDQFNPHSRFRPNLHDILYNLRLGPQVRRRIGATEVALGKTAAGERVPPHIVDGMCGSPDCSLPHAQALFIRAGEHISDKMWDDALADLKAAAEIATDPRHILYHVVRQDAALVSAVAMGKSEEARAWLSHVDESMLSKHCLRHSSCNTRAALLLLDRDWPAARDALDELRALIQTDSPFTTPECLAESTDLLEELERRYRVGSAPTDAAS